MESRQKSSATRIYKSYFQNVGWKGCTAIGAVTKKNGAARIITGNRYSATGKLPERSVSPSERTAQQEQSPEIGAVTLEQLPERGMSRQSGHRKSGSERHNVVVAIVRRGTVPQEWSKERGVLPPNRSSERKQADKTLAAQAA